MNFLSMNPLSLNRSSADGINSTFYDYNKVIELYVTHELYLKDGYFDRNIAEVHITLESNIITYIDESAATSTSQLLGSLGGVIGLYLGVCLVSIAELVEFFCLLIYIVLQQCFRTVSSEESHEMVRWAKY